MWWRAQERLLEARGESEERRVKDFRMKCNVGPLGRVRRTAKIWETRGEQRARTVERGVSKPPSQGVERSAVVVREGFEELEAEGDGSEGGADWM